MSHPRNFARTLVLVVGLLLGGLLTSVAHAQTPIAAPVSGGTLNVATAWEPDTLYPPMAVSGASYTVLYLIYDRLIWIDPATGAPEPYLAESWAISDDGLTLTFTLRDGVTFTDGTPLDAAAVKTNLEAWLSPEKTASISLGDLETVEAPDATTLVLTFASPYAPIFTSLATIGIYSPTAYAADPEGFGRMPVGSGPFMLTDWTSGTSISLARNPEYVNYVPADTNRGPAYLDGIQLNIIPETATQVAAFENDELNIIRITRDEYAQFADNPAYQVVTTENTSIIMFLQYQDTAPFTEESLRQAIAYAVNVPQIAELAYRGGAQVNQCPLPTGVVGYNAALCAEHGYTYDPDRAREILAAAGWTDSDGDGFVEIAGSSEPLVLYTSGPTPDKTRVLELIQADLAAVGINLELEVLEGAALLGLMNDGTADFIYAGWGYPEASMLSLIYKSPGWAGPVLGSPELDELLAATDTTVDPVARAATIDAAMVYILDHAISTPIVTPFLEYATHVNVHGFKLNADSVPHYTDVWLAPAE